ncbi:MAG: CRTAC1 family protein, partial [Akkermansiaceae bacterium]|nr:CRTAC1 family protein [Akkermansiaceae bacterium]
VVQWPGGGVQSYADFAADRLYTITQGWQDAGPAGSRPPAEQPPLPLYGPSLATGDVIHRENAYDDFARQPLLPNKLSRLGPALAVGDVNGDGREDLFAGGAAGAPGRLFLNKSGRYVGVEGSPLEGDRAAEDMGALFLDADRDGDLDLYVAGGGYEFEEDADELRDRLYLNDGKGNFQQAPETALPEARDSGSCVVACDFDRDGDLDLFVGGRVIPGRYPLSPNSRLLRNDSTPGTVRFADVTDSLAPGLRESGLVTGALWSDADHDGWPDLLVAHEWGPIKVYRNAEGTLQDRTAESGTGELLGWWNGITGRDLDGDGDIDYVVTNFGLNTKYHATPGKPARLYYGDFDGSGKPRLVEAEYEGETLFPIRGKSCSTAAMPHLANKFGSFRAFAMAELQEIYTPQCLEDSHTFEAKVLESGVLLNDGAGHFRFQPLPRIAQISPAFGVKLTELNGDGHPDLYLVQNFFSPQIETGRMDGGVSQAFLGKGDGRFVPLEPSRSGLVVPGDAMSLVVTDLDGDRRPDFVVGINDDQALAFRQQGERHGGTVQVRLQGAPGNPTAVGARVGVVLEDGHRQTAEVYAGDGYLGQSSPVLTFGIPPGESLRQIDVRWPDGSESTSTPDPSQKIIEIRKGS